MRQVGTSGYSLHRWISVYTIGAALPRKTDVNRLLTKLRNQFYLLYNAKTVEQRRAMLDALAADIARYPVDVKPGRFAPRNLAAVPRPCDMKNCSGL